MDSTLTGRTIAVLGANGQIGRVLCEACLNVGGILYPFVRNNDTISKFTASSGVEAIPYEMFATGSYDVIINAAGPGDPAVHRQLDSKIIEILDRLDLLVLDYLDTHGETIYIYFSTGAIYDGDYKISADDTSTRTFSVGMVDVDGMYPLAKLVAESRHRARVGAHIADIRLFGFVSKYLPQYAGFFLSQVSNAIKSNIPLDVSGENFVRDIVGPCEVIDLIEKIVASGKCNDAYDLYSADPVTKFELLDVLSSIYGLVVRFSDPVQDAILMHKPVLITKREQSKAVGYMPSRTSAEVVVEEFSGIIHEKT